jgi:hypothetical protein
MSKATAQADQVDPSQRFSQERPCPACQGWQGGPNNCFGYFASAAPIFFCTNLGDSTCPRNESAVGQPWTHRAKGACLCGVTHAPEGGLTLEEFRDAKFPTFTVKDLERKGLWQAGYGVENAPAVFFAYVDGDLGDIFQPYRTRIRVSLTANADGKRFFWKKEKTEKKPLVPYGLDQLAEARRIGRLVICEGETDALSCWFLGIPAIGLPGAGVWKHAWTEQYFSEIDTIFVIVEQQDGKPDSGAESIFHWLSKSSLRHRAHLVRCETFKDVNDLYLDKPEKFADRLGACLGQAESWAEFEKSYAALQRQALTEQCKDLLAETNLLNRLAQDAHKRWLVREDRTIKLLYLIRQSVEISTDEDQACSGILKGQSSAGKNVVLKAMLAFLPEDAVNASTLTSPKNLFYTEGGRDEYAHKTLVLYEGAALANDDLAYVVRTLISEGRLKLNTVIDHKSKTLDKNGPTNLLTTTTKITLDPELETRAFSIPIDEGEEQTRLITEMISKKWAGEKQPDVDLAPWHAFHRYLVTGRTKKVIIPFKELGSAVPALMLRLRRDWPGVLKLVATHAWLHQAHRKVDAEGQILAEWQDYTTVHDLVDDLLAEAADLKISDSMRKTVLAASALYDALPKRDFGYKRGLTYEEIAKKRGVHKSTAMRHCEQAIDAGYLYNDEVRVGRPAKIRPTTLQMPQDKNSILPRRTPVSILRTAATVQPKPKTPIRRRPFRFVKVGLEGRARA